MQLRRGNMKRSTWIKSYWNYDPKIGLWIHPGGIAKGCCTDEFLQYLTRNKK